MISAYEYKMLIKALYDDTPKNVICSRLRISRPTHDKRLEQGITDPKEASRFRNIVATNTTLLRARARLMDHWTTSDEIRIRRRITHIN